ncbi:MAG TPA: hypothetical protein VHE37_00175 [Nevskiaceae bacterium]|nr:hypothetical protein [Nevskiaceae bacterium]
MWRALRIALLFLLMLGVGADAWLTRARSTSWQNTLWVGIYPIAGDDSADTARYLAALTRDDFLPIEDFMAREAHRHGIALGQPLHVVRGRTLAELPPAPPRDRSPLSIAQWSLQLRWWSHEVESAQPGPPSNIRVYVIYHDPQRQPVVPHSLGLQKGLIGVVHAFASSAQGGSNDVVIAHELMHTLGATDKYDPVSTLPSFPDGYADPQAQPRWPQARAEIMGGRVPLSATQAEIPRSLASVVVGPATAREIGWTR